LGGDFQPSPVEIANQREITNAFNHFVHTFVAGTLLLLALTFSKETSAKPPCLK
jgi:hypothetical protein